MVLIKIFISYSVILYIKFVNENEILILLKEKFKSERGRINCSLPEANGKWRWLGIQYVIAKYQ